jgi:superfamily II DNA or RNA helicase
VEKSKPQSFRDLDLLDRYSSSTSDLLDDFYIPMLSNAAKYDRAVGYFSSAILVIAEAALTPFAAGGGKIRLICSPQLSQDDADAIVQGSLEGTVSRSLNEELDRWDEDASSNAPSSLLRSLVSRGVIEVKIAIPWNRQGIFHSKIGVFTDYFGNELGFTGSVNETFRGWSTYGNHEQVDTFRGWIPPYDDRVTGIQVEFDSIWSGLARGLKVLSGNRLSEVFERRPTDLDEERAIKEFAETRKFRKRRDRSTKKVSSDKNLQEHQQLAIDNWNAANKRGIIDFVTGGGKTFTAISLIREWIETGNPALVLVPSVILHAQWRDEILKEMSGEGVEIIEVGAGTRRATWLKHLRNALEFQNSDSRIIILSTYDSAQNHAFINIVRKYEDRLLVCADEVHRIGATENQRIMNDIASRSRLGLSATPQRFGDPRGTEKIFDYFGDVIKPSFTIEDAIKAGRLVPYQYWVKEVQLDFTEDEKFEKLTSQIRIAMSKTDQGEETNVDYLLRERAKIVKEASAKIPLACALIQENYRGIGHWLVYCNSRAQMDAIQTRLRAVDIDSLQYHSALDKPREETLTYFTREGGILLAIKCLDEGIDIPKIDTAVVIASSSNPREYIQRRGRILRWSPGKYDATLYDVLVERLDGSVALDSDLIRAGEIASSAENSELVGSQLKFIMSRSGQMVVDNSFEESEEDDR